MIIQNSNIEDIDSIFTLYKIATDYQKTKGSVFWPDFDPAMVAQEIKEQRQWKIIINSKIACVWATTDSDPEIWQDRNKDPSIYIHRIATHPEFRGKSLVSHIIDWSKRHARARDKKYIRMDTVGDNKGLINYYTSCGFDFLGLSILEETTSLPAHYHNATVSLFEMEV